MSLALWLRAGRAERGLTLDDVARVTKIQPRILERLEGGKLDGLPAEVFVRGFIRSFARCCGLDESEALTRYTAASAAQAGIPLPPTSAAPATARAMVEVMADLAPQVARVTPVSPTVLKRAPTQAIEVVDYAERGGADRLAAGSLAIPVAAVEMPAEVAAEVTADASEASEPTEAASADSDSRASRAKKKQRGKKRSKRKSIATGTPWLPTPVVMQAVEPPSDLALAVEASTTIAVEASSTAPANASPSVDVAEAPAHSEAEIEAPVAPVDHLDPLVPAPADNDDIVATEIWQPKIPQAAAAPSVPWRRPAYAQASRLATASIPTLVIDDADPDSAEQVMEDRASAQSVLTHAQRRSFLPPILLDREDRGARQGGLTLAVIILLIAATLTLSYLMRRPSSSGDGVTQRTVETQLIG